MPVGISLLYVRTGHEAWNVQQTGLYLWRYIYIVFHIGIILILSDDTKVMNRYLKDHKFLLSAFPARVDVKALTNDMLVAYGKEYAKEQEYAVDELGLLALHTCIENRQTMEHAVTTSEVEELVDKAIKHANRKTVGHFFSILFAKRYDEEDMIILTENDFD